MKEINEIFDMETQISRCEQENLTSNLTCPFAHLSSQTIPYLFH